MNSRKIILAKNPKLANSRNSRKFLPKISRIFPLAKVSSAKVSSFKVAIGYLRANKTDDKKMICWVSSVEEDRGAFNIFDEFDDED